MGLQSSTNSGATHLASIMRWRRLRQPSFLVGAANLLLLSIVLLLVTAQADPPVDSRLTQRDTTLSQLRDSLDVLSSRVDARTDELEEGLSQLQKSVDGTAAPAPEVDVGIELHTKSDADDVIRKLGETPSATKLAEAVAMFDVWIASEEEQAALDEYKSQLLSKLRGLIAREVSDFHKQALRAEGGGTASSLHARAGQLLALYPMDSNEEVLNQARLLSSRHSEVGARIEVIRRQRYNAWAMDRIEETIKQVNTIASSFKTSDNPKMIEASVEWLGPIDPVLLEPVVAQVYNYALEHAKANISAEQQLQLGNRLVNPAITRKGYGDF